MSNEKKNDGGPAYPMVGSSNTPKGELYVWSEGMSLRDHFAGLAMGSIIQWQNTEAGCIMIKAAMDTDGSDPDDAIGQMAYAYADAMLKAREQ